ncbi:MAG TPA: HEAT repeat domain-containing protein [Myxococcaceae bacterium]|nr:HEAT repeat domain-containing protein [Myxococcaceae bacterium]
MGTKLRGAFLVLSAACLLPFTAFAQEESRPLRKVTCSLASMLDDVRGGLKSGSPAYRNYLLKQLKEAAFLMPASELRAAFERERDPAMVEALGAALASKASREPDAKMISPLLARATRDPDPAARAAAVRGLRGIGSVEMMAKTREATYAQLVRDASPEVREAVAGNLIHENSQIYFGHDKDVSEMAIQAAEASQDPAITARLLKEVSMEQVGPQAVRALERQLGASDPTVRAAAATALGGVPGPEVAGARGRLVDLYRAERDPAVRKAVLESIARLGFQSSLPALESLRGVDPTLTPEIDAWTAALKKNLQEWSLLKREKQRLRP